MNPHIAFRLLINSLESGLYNDNSMDIHYLVSDPKSASKCSYNANHVKLRLVAF